MFSLQRLSLCSIPLYKYRKFRKNVYYLFKYTFNKSVCERCDDVYRCFCLGSFIHDVLRSEYDNTIWMLFNCASEVIVYSQTDVGKLFDYLYERRMFINFREDFEWNGYGDYLLLDHYSCFQVRVNNSIDNDILCDMYSKLLLKLRHNTCQFVNCKFFEVYANIAAYLYNLKILRNDSFFST